MNMNEREIEQLRERYKREGEGVWRERYLREGNGGIEGKITTRGRGVWR